MTLERTQMVEQIHLLIARAATTRQFQSRGIEEQVPQPPFPLIYGAFSGKPYVTPIAAVATDWQPRTPISVPVEGYRGMIVDPAAS
jgi:hypothetical protein